MSLRDQETETRLGFSGTDRFIGIQPPLTEEDIDYLVYDHIVSQQDVRQITGDPGYTLVNVVASGTEEGIDRVVRARAMRIAHSLEFTRARGPVGMLLNNMVDISDDPITLFD